MGLMRSVLLACAGSSWMRDNAPKLGFVRRAVSRFMPGEKIQDALSAAQLLKDEGIGTVLTHLGENITDPAEADSVADHYINILDRIDSGNLPIEVSVKLTQLGLDLDQKTCLSNLTKILVHAGEDNLVWIDMESSDYVGVTLGVYRRVRAEHKNVGICLQSYLYRTEEDLANLMPLGPAVRLVKGAYKEPPSRAYPRKADVDESFFKLTQQLLSEEARNLGVRVALATHNPVLIQKTMDFAYTAGLPKDSFEFQMLFGIQRHQQLRLAREGYKSTVLISYGEYWYPWFMRRLAERPANVLFVARNLLPRIPRINKS